MIFTSSFGRLKGEDTYLVGGKCASLHRMYKEGFPVPDGFVVFAPVFDDLLKRSGIAAGINTLLEKKADPEELNKASEKIRGLIEKIKVPKDTRESILKSYRELKCASVAVRSSASSEDSPSHAWAGQLESYLCVCEKDLVKYIKKCWASLYTPRAILYRKHNRFSGDIGVAVVVQKMIKADVSGVCFTTDPVTLNKNRMVVEACWGLGEALVRGMITPDTYILEKSTLKTIEKFLSSQSKKIVRAFSGTKIKPVSGKLRSKTKLTPSQLRKVAGLCLKLEKFHGCPQDVEWAAQKGRFFILQSRPITTFAKNLK